MQLTLQDLLDNRQIQAAGPGLGLNSAITKERKPNEHDQQQTRRSGFMGAVPLPWDALHEFGRMICLGFMVTFGARAAQQAMQEAGKPNCRALRGAAKPGPRSCLTTLRPGPRKRFEHHRLPMVPNPGLARNL